MHCRAGQGTMTQLPVINVTIFSDLACPWCWVGHRRLSAAIKQLGGKAVVQPEWHAYLLDPNCPERGETWASWGPCFARGGGVCQPARP